MVHMDSVIEPVRDAVRSVMSRFAKDLDKLSGGKITPNMITITGLVMHVPIAWLIATGQLTLAAILLIFFGLFDTLDGALAKYKNIESKIGMFLDSVTDRIKEVIIYIGISYYFVSLSEPIYAVWAIAACGAAVTVSYINAWGEVATSDIKSKNHKQNKTFRSGLMTFDVRVFILVVALFTSNLEIGVVIVTILTWLTAFQRINNVTNHLK